jgi:hypothetical protein
MGSELKAARFSSEWLRHMEQFGAASSTTLFLSQVSGPRSGIDR